MTPANQRPSAALPKEPASFFQQFLHPSGDQGWYIVLLGITGVLLVVLTLYGFLFWKGSKSKIIYTPADIAYGEKIHAVHEMGSTIETDYRNVIISDPLLQPKLRISEIFYDFGDVNSPQVLTRTFIIANIGDSPLIILHAYTTCGCTVADFSSSEIPPGKVVLMTLRLDTGFHEMRGTTIRRGVILETNDPDDPLQEIWVQASVR